MSNGEPQKTDEPVPEEKPFTPPPSDLPPKEEPAKEAEKQPLPEQPSEEVKPNPAA